MGSAFKGAVVSDLDRLDSINLRDAATKSGPPQVDPTRNPDGAVRQTDTTHDEADPVVLTLTAGTTTVNGAIDSDGDTDNFQLTVASGQTLMISVAGLGDEPLLDSLLVVSAPGPLEPDHDDDGGLGSTSLITFAAGPGTYTFTVGAYPGSGLTGDYQLSVHTMGTDIVPGDLESEVTAEVDALTHGFLESGSDIDVYAVELTAGTLYNFEVAGGTDYEYFWDDLPPGELDTIITIYNSEGEVLVDNDDINFGNGDIGSACSLLAVESGTYYCEISHSPLAGNVDAQVGGYTLDISAAEVELPEVAVGGEQAGSIEVPDELDFYTLDLTEGQTVMISLVGTGETPLEDTFLTLVDPGSAEIAHDDDGGLGTYSLITITAAEAGTYTIGVEAYPESGLTGDYEISVEEMTTDSVPDDFTSEIEAVVGETTFGFLESGDDSDFYTLDLTEGTFYTFDVSGGADYESFWDDLPPGELDTFITIYDSEGNPVAFNDDVNFGNGDIGSAAGFVAEESGTYYCEVSHSPFAEGEQIGGYTLTIGEVDISGLDPLDAIDWGTQLESNDVLVYFAGEGEEFDGVTSLGWQEFEIDAAMTAFQTWADVSDLTFTITDSSEAATFHLVTTESEEFLGYFNPPGETNEGVGVFAVNGAGWDDEGGLDPGGYGFITLVHEFGHGLGLAHPHDNGGTSEIMPGVVGPFGSYGVFDLNQGVYTVMSYNDGWQLHPDAVSGFPPGFPLTWGYESGPGAFDIALIQEKYGADIDHNNLDTTYLLDDLNVDGTGWHTIWDTGGLDEIVHDGNASAVIDLTAATLDYTATGGGVLSWVEGIFGGLTIANGVVIENATGGDGDDVLIGNDAGNALTGRGGNDHMMGGSGNDTLNGGAGNDTMDGGDGDDLLKVNKAGDVVSEVLEGGTDTVESTITYTLSAHLENLILGGGGAIDGTGTVHGNVLTGNSASNKLTGGGGNDTLNGNGGNDTLLGGSGNDTLDGGAGNDTLKGGNGDDLMKVNSSGDAVSEAANQGTDTVESAVSYTLGNHIENLMLTGGANGTGNALGNTISGNAAANTLLGRGGSDTLSGGGGNDTMNGGGGADHFVFDTATGAGNVDRIIGFVDDVDEIVLDQSIFAALGTGALSASQFVASSTATALDADDHLLYDTDNGRLYYDADGNGGGAAVQIAQLTGAPSIDADDFLVVT